MFDGSDRYEQDYGTRSEPAEEPEKGTVGLLEVSHTLYSEGMPPEPANPADCGPEWLDNVSVKCERVERVSAIKETGSEHSGLLPTERRAESLEEDKNANNSYRDLSDEARFEDDQATQTLKYSDFPENRGLYGSIFPVRDPYLSYTSQLLQYPNEITNQTESVGGFSSAKFSSSPTHTEIYRPVATPLRHCENGYGVVYPEARTQSFGATHEQQCKGSSNLRTYTHWSLSCIVDRECIS